MRRYKVICGRDQLYCDNRDEAIATARSLKYCDEAHSKDHIYVVSETLIWFDGKTYKNGRIVGDDNA